MKKHFIFVNPITRPERLTPNLTKNMSSLACLAPIEERVSFPFLTAVKNTVKQGETCKITAITINDKLWTERNLRTFREEIEFLRYGKELYTFFDEYFSEKCSNELRAEIERKRTKKQAVSEKDEAYLEYLEKSHKVNIDELKRFIKRTRRDGKENEFQELIDKEIKRLNDNETPVFKYELNEIKMSADENSDTLTRLLFEILDIIDNSKDEELYFDFSFGPRTIPVVANMALTYLYRYGNGLLPKMMAYGAFQYDDKEEKKDNDSQTDDVNRSLVYDISSLIYLNSAFMNLDKMDSENPKDALKQMILDDDNEELEDENT